MIKDRIGSGLGFVCALFGAALAMGCDGSGTEKEIGDVPAQLVEEVCKQECACETCSDQAMQDCLDGGYARRDESNAKDCTELWKETIECLYQNPVCDAGQVLPGQCAGLVQDLDACIVAWDELYLNCDDLRTELAAAWNQCGLSPPAEPEGCEAPARAQLKCEKQCVILRQTCEVLSGADAELSPVLQACLEGCASN